jgi:hypothetical protein
MSKNVEHRDYGGSSGTGIKSNIQSRTAGTSASTGPQDDKALDDLILISVNGRQGDRRFAYFG